MRVRIPFSELEFTYARSSGPGGQNVNKVNSKAVLRWNARESATLAQLRDPRIRDRILSQLAPDLNDAGEWVIASDRFRDQPRNREDCIQKLHQRLSVAATIPKVRKKTKPTRSSKLNRVDSKRRESEKKRLRGKRWD